MGGGCEIVLGCDLAVAAASASFALPEVKRGLFAAGGVFRLPRQIPRRIAMEMVLTGEPLSADRALALGLVNRMVPDENLLDAALELAAVIGVNAPLAVQGSKRLMYQSFQYGWLPEIWSLNDELIEQILGSADGREEARAFAEKRVPVWQGR